MNSPPPSSDNADHLPRDDETIRNLLLDKSTDDLAHEFPGLIETISTPSIDREETIHYVVGVSFTTHGTGFDYWIDRVFRRQETGTVATESVKAPIHEDHPYVTFDYPPDQAFDAAALRAVLIAEIQSQTTVEDDRRGATDEETSWMERLRSPFESVIRTLWSL